MANTFSSLQFHIIFSTKNRRPWIHEDIEERVWEYLGGIARAHGGNALQVGGVEDHLHVLLGTPPALAVSTAVQALKGGSSKWIHDTFPVLAPFEWQRGYGAFSVSASNIPTVIQYIESQREHHRRLTFQEEYLAILKRHGVQYDERYLWG